MKTTDTAYLFGEGGHLSDEGIALYVDALNLGRTRELPLRVLEHVEDCLTCKEEVTGLLALVPAGHAAEAGPHPFFDRPAERTSERRILYRMAAGMAAVIGIGVLTYMLVFRGSDRPTPGATPVVQVRPDTSAIDTGRPAAPRSTPSHELLAARFEPSPELEDLLHSTTRSAETSVRSPANGITLQPGALFAWSTDERPPFTITVMDNHRHTVRTIRSAATAVTWKDTLTPGLYYWKLSAGDELLHVGSFIVR